jgi:hypothetical protein
MGSLQSFNLSDLLINSNIDTFVETGTYTGNALEYALSTRLFKKFYSVELLEKYYNSCLQKFINNENIELVHNNSIDGLKYILKKIKDKNVLFWLDAHLPNFYDGKFTNNYVDQEDLLIPLKGELDIIKKEKDISNDVFLIDDLRIYEPGPFESGNWEEVYKNEKYKDGINFVYNILENTHDIQKLYKDEGYIICIPKNKL